MNELVKYWRKFKRRGPPYWHPDDAKKMRTVPRDERPLYRSFGAFACSDAMGSGKDHAVHPGLLPMPFAGNILKAKVYILLLNPGCDVRDYKAEADPKYRRATLRNLKQRNRRGKYPFFYLNPDFAWTPGGSYWRRQLRDIIGRVQKERGFESYREATSWVADRIASLELFPYHSGKFGRGDKLEALPSVLAMQHFVLGHVLRRVKSGKAVAIVVRSAARWGLVQRSGFCIYRGGETRKASLGPKTRGGKAILSGLLR